MKHAVGVPIGHSDGLLRRVLAAGHPVAWLEEGDAGKYVRRRYVRRIVVGRDSFPTNARDSYPDNRNKSMQGMETFGLRE